MKPVVHEFSSGEHTLTLEVPGLYEVRLTEPGAEVSVRGVFAAEGREQVVVSVVIHHQAPHTRAKTTLKGVARDDARLRFVGKIVIDPECPDSNSFLTERILLLSDTASAEAIPELEILTDQVKCSHAASISHIPEAQLFYLMSRGISRAHAETLIVDGFLAD